MTATTHHHRNGLPTRFEDLVRLMPPMAITSDGQCERFAVVIDRLMAIPRLTKGQEAYLETLVQLVQVYEAANHAIAGLRGIDVLRHLLAEHAMSASELARLLGVHPSMGSKILKGERALTVDHLRSLASRFKVRADTFIDPAEAA